MTKPISPVTECLKGHLSFDYKEHRGISILMCQHQREICSHSLEMLSAHGTNILSTKQILALEHILRKPCFYCCWLSSYLWLLWVLLFQSHTSVTPQIPFFMWGRWNSCCVSQNVRETPGLTSEMVIDSDDIRDCAVGAGFPSHTSHSSYSLPVAAWSFRESSRQFYGVVTISSPFCRWASRRFSIKELSQGYHKPYCRQTCIESLLWEGDTALDLENITSLVEITTLASMNKV